ncbi:MAG: nitrite reductase large subunit NirB [Myxococcota bacterium]
MSAAPRETRSVCGFCGVGCGVVVLSEGDRVVGVRGDETHPANRGRLCSKGRALHETVHLPDRILQPAARRAKGAPLEPTRWDAALERLSGSLRSALALRGPESVGFYLSGQLTTEDYYAFNKLAKGFLGVNQVDSNSRLCMSSSVSGYQRAFGVDGPPTCYEDIDHADLLLVVGANMAFCHPVLFQRIEAARGRAQDRPALVVLDPRRSATAERADLHVALRPGSDGVFLTGLLAELARRGRLDRAYIAAHTEGFEALEAILPEFGAERVERECFVPRAQLARVADLFAGARAALSLWAMGVNQSAHATDTVNAITNLHLAGGQLGRPGAGPFSLTGQPNAMGGREVGAMATLLAAHRSLGSEADRRELEALWRSGPISAVPGRTAVELFEHAAQGGLEVLWIVATNPAVTLPDQRIVRRALERTPLVVLQDVVSTTDTVAFADLLLPAAGWAEKAGTMTNSERGVSRLREAVPPPGEALPDWRIAALVAKRLGFGAEFAWRDDTEVWSEHAATTRGRDCDMSGMTPARLESGPLRWPCPSPAHPGSDRLYTQASFPTPSGRARFVVPQRFANAEVIDDERPIALTTGRLRDQWHTMTKTGRVPRLLAHAPEPSLELAPADAAREGIADGDRVRISSARGSFEMRAAITDALPSGLVFAPMHWSAAFAPDALVNAATHATLDPVSKQPELKHAAVRVERVAHAPRETPAASVLRVVCSCHGVPAGAIRGAIAEGARSVLAIGAACRAGGSCGTCGPELATLLRDALAQAPESRRETVVVVGNGMVGHRFVEKLVEYDTARRFRVIVVGEEPRPAYDRVHLSDLFAGRTSAELALADADAYLGMGVELRTGERVVSIDREAACVVTGAGARIAYDRLVLATGSAPFVPPLPGRELEGVFVYRTIEDLDAIRAYAHGARSAAVLGGGLLGLEAAKALRDLGLETHVVEAAPRLMPRQLDLSGASALRRRIEALGVHVRVGAQTQALVCAERDDAADLAPDDPAFLDAGGEVAGDPDGDEQRVAALRFADGERLDVDLVVISAGIRPRDELAADSGLARGERGGVIVDDRLRTSDPRIQAIGEVALHRSVVYGLVAPGYAMAEVAALQLVTDGEPGARVFTGADLSTKLKLLGVDVASFGDPFAANADEHAIVCSDAARDVYAKLVLSDDRTRLRGGMLVGDVSEYGRLLQLVREGGPLPERAEELLYGPRSSLEPSPGADDATLVCSCNSVSRGSLCRAIRVGSLENLAAVKQSTRAGTGCGGCLPLVSGILREELAARGLASATALCEHFAYSRRELFEIAKIGAVRSFEALIASHGQGDGCEVCKPTVASVLASLWNEPIQTQATIQDTNDRFLANIQRGGTYSVIPRVPGGEITPEKLIVLGQVARKYGLYCKITGGQRIDLLGARVDQLPEIFEELVAAGFESGHAYGKAMRTIKSCVGTTWCRYGVQDSTALAIRLEQRYRGIRAPHKLKSAVSGCIRECAEAQSKDFGVIATEKGWNLYVCGNGGSKPRHAELLAADVDGETLVRYVDRFLMYYIQTADRLTRTARWLEALPGGIEYLRKVVIDDHLGLCAELERQIQGLVDGYECEWAQVVRDPEQRKRFRHFADSNEADDSLRWVEERGQRRPADWTRAAPGESPLVSEIVAPELRWIPLAAADEIPHDGGIAVRYGDVQLALYHVARRNRWYASQNRCPHTGDMVLARGIVGDERGAPKIACPQHKKTFDLETGRGLSDPELQIAVFPVRLDEGKLFVELPPADVLARSIAPPPTTCAGCTGHCTGEKS